MSYTGVGIIVLVSFLVSLALTALEIPILIRRQTGQNIREEGPQSHRKKSGTPSMGGIAIIGGIVAATLLAGKMSFETVIVICAVVLFGIIGFLDDYLKVIKKQNEGLKAWQKFGFQLVIAAALALYMAYFSDFGTAVFIPFAKIYVDFGMWYIPFIIFAIVAMVNAVNLTDGLDGLASGVTALVALFFAVTGSTLALHTGSAFCAAMTGACLGFLVYNKNPAKVFMGDTGSLALGGGLVTAAIIMKLELLLPIAGFVYVMEVLSVVLQVAYFKATGGKRIFRMSPLHHHFELGGMKERKVVALFWLATLVCCLVGLLAA